MSLLLAFLPAEGFALSLQDTDSCPSCHCAQASCCVQPTGGTVPTRNIPAPSNSSISLERFVQAAESVLVPPGAPELQVASVDRNLLPVRAVPLRALYCTFLI